MPPAEPVAPVDWDAAARLAARLAPPGPAAGRAQLEDLVAGLRRSAAAAAGHVALLAELPPADGRPPAEASRVHVVDRARWSRANVATFAALTEPVTAAIAARDPRAAQVSAAGRAAGAAQVGSVLALLSGKVLGQFDPFVAGPGEPGRLLLVAPNVLAAERALGVDPADFRLWVCLHEQTHALQFARAPWLAAHLRERAAGLGAGLAERVLPRDGREDRDGRGGSRGRWRGGARGTSGRPGDGGAPGCLAGLEELVRGVDRALRGPGSLGLLELLPAPERRALDEVTAVMSLLEGHADVTMDAVGTDVVPTVRHLRRRFEARRDAAGRSVGPERVLRRLLGLDAKLAQYRDGARFVRRVQRRVGLAGLNAVWDDPAHLPTPSELARPADWVRRVHG
ncbi:zinc-dependent metalloprotease [Cellulomonas endophytica]|uniref:zinc-dependent metalloprotease n=1 Tax=Cellulomonas endophytica TaxID=2494735 RepID=UPI0010117D05|nr:zinc-dependent metalloprotease [Cellulomonas endophytica]